VFYTHTQSVLGSSQTKATMIRKYIHGARLIRYLEKYFNDTVTKDLFGRFIFWHLSRSRVYML